MNRFFLIIILIAFTRCSSPKVEFKEYDIEHNTDVRTKILKSYNAENNNKSLLVFTSGFQNENLTIVNYDTIFSGTLRTDAVLQLSKSFGVSNEYNVEITEIERDYKFVLKKKLLKKYKYVYVRRGTYDELGKYTITYSNNMRVFK